MQALHSSSALAVNVFQYWESIHQVPVIAAACGVCKPGELTSAKIVFEEKFHIKGIRGSPPNMDVDIHPTGPTKFKLFAIESKFIEPYRTYKLKGLKTAYLNKDELWAEIPELHKLARAICPENTLNKYLDSAQLIKHILGLKYYCKKNEYKLLYLWYEAMGKAGADHRNEIDTFASIARSDGVHFSALTYQELIISMVRNVVLKFSTNYPYQEIYAKSLS